MGKLREHLSMQRNGYEKGRYGDDGMKLWHDEKGKGCMCTILEIIDGQVEQIASGEGDVGKISEGVRETNKVWG